MQLARQTSDTLILRDGRSVKVRRLEPSDDRALAVAFSRLSARTRLARFGAVKPVLKDRELRYLVDIDHHRHEALLALDPETDAIVAVARYACAPDELSTADIALTVGDPWQGQGLGSALARMLERRAREEGIQRLTATVRADNERSLRMLHGLGFSLIESGQGTVELARDLTV